MDKAEFEGLLKTAKAGGHVVFACQTPIRKIVFKDSNGVWDRVFPDDESFDNAIRCEAWQVEQNAECRKFVEAGGQTKGRHLSKYAAKKIRQRREAEEREARRADAERRRKERARIRARERYVPVEVDGRRVSLLRARKFVDKLQQERRLPAAASEKEIPPRPDVRMDPGVTQAIRTNRTFGLKPSDF